MRIFPTDPNAHDGPDRSEYVRSGHANRTRRRLRVLSLARTAPTGSGWPPVTQLRPLGHEGRRSAA
jgi:hypothetical protein